MAKTGDPRKDRDHNGYGRKAERRMNKWDRAVSEGHGTARFVPATLDNAEARARAQR